jgi:hypothetical protein
VLNVRPSAAVTVAEVSSIARTAIRFVATGNASRCHDRPSVESRTVPAGPTSQQTDGEGDAPAVSVTVTPVCSVRHDAPPSADR